MVRVLVALGEYLGSVPSLYMEAHTPTWQLTTTYTPVLGDMMPSSGLLGYCTTQAKHSHKIKNR